MPRRIQLPNGQWVYIPDVDPYVEQILSGSPSRADPPPWTPAWDTEEEEDEGTLAGSAWEGFKSIPSGVADIFFSGLQATIGVATPFADLPIEKGLRRRASKRARERDPAYQDALLPAVGTGLGQVAGLSALSRLPGGWYATVGAGIGMGISEQTRRIADYEQRTGTNVPWYKESAAHLAGALIGLTEVVPVKGMFPTSVQKMMERMKGGVAPNSFRNLSKLEQTLGLKGAANIALQEAAQEASANWLQSISARGLYDPNAMEDVARSMAEDFKVGGIVGGIAKLVQHQILGAKFRKWNLDTSLEEPLREAQWRDEQMVRDIADHITGISDTMPETLRQLGIEEGLSQDVTRMFGGKWASIPYGLDNLLMTGRITRPEVQDLIREFQRRNIGAKIQLDELIEHHSKLGNPVGNYERAKVAIDEMVEERVEKLRRTVNDLPDRLGDRGGISGTQEYQDFRQELMEAEQELDINLVDIQQRREEARRRGETELESFYSQIISLSGGSYGASGLLRMMEDLGVHGGKGSETVSTDVDPDFRPATSDQANFDLSHVGEVIFTSSGRHPLSTEQQTVNNSDVLDGILFHAGTEARSSLDALDTELETIESNNDRLYRSPDLSFTRELSEIQRGKKFESDSDWESHRDTTQEYVLNQTQTSNAEISRIKRERSLIYLHLLSGRLNEVKARLVNDPEDKKKIAERIFGKPALDEPAAVVPPAARVAMNFKDGARGMRMRKGLEGKSTMELIEEGVRTGTSRQRKDIKANVGDVVEFYDKTGKTIRARVTKGWTKLDQIDPKYWSQIEGWDIAAYNKLADAGYWQYEYELIPDEDTSYTDRFDGWLDKTIIAVEQSKIAGERMGEIAQEQRDNFMNGLAARTDISQETKDALKAQFLANNARRYTELPRDISASQFIKIADLFIDDPKDADKKEHSRKRALQGALISRAFQGISNWQVEDALYEVGVDGVPVPNETSTVVKRFIRRLGDDVTDEFGRATLKDGDPKSISAEDIAELLQSKNIYLRDGKRIGKELAKITGAGVESGPFRKLLLDMTGAPSWKEATYAQRLLMYSRLLQLPAHYESRSTPEEQRYLSGLGPDGYSPLFLPDFYYDPSIDNHIDFLTDAVVEATEYGDQNYPSLAIGKLKERAEDALGEEFDNESFYEAAARLIEIGVFNRSNKSAPRKIRSPAQWVLQEERDVAKEESEEAWKRWVSRITLQSGGARGADSAWGSIGEEYGLSPGNIIHFHSAQHTTKRLPRMNTLISEEELAEADPHVRKAAIALGKTWKGRHSAGDDYLRRDWFQVRDADQVFAIGRWNPNQPGTVHGGTGWGVQMAIDNAVDDVFFFEQNEGQWYTVDYDENTWVHIATPSIETFGGRPELSTRFAGIGEEALNIKGKEAIRQVYAQTQANFILADQQLELGIGGFRRDTWVELLNTYGIVGEGGKNPEFPWGTMPDDQRLKTDSDEEWLAKKWEPVIKIIFPDLQDVDVEFIKPEDEMEIFGNPYTAAHLRHYKVAADGTKQPGEVVQISYRRLKKRFPENLGAGGIFYESKYVLNIDPRDFYDENELMLHMIGHEFSHARLSVEQYGQQRSGGFDRAEYERKGKAYGEYENEINRMALAEVDSYMMDQIEKLHKKQRAEAIKEERGRVADAVSESRVVFNVSYDEGMVQQPGDRDVVEDFWHKESDPELLRRLLEDEDARWAEQVDAVWASYQEKNPGKPLSREEFIDIYTPVLTSTAGLQELSDQGILGSILGAVAMPGRMAPTESVLELGTAEGRSLVQGLMKEGALPSDLRDNVHTLRRRFIDTMETRFEVLDKNVEQLIKRLRLPDNIQRQYVDDADGLFQFLSDVAIRGDVMEGDVAAMYDRPGNRIIINLAAIDPNNMVEAQEIVRSAAFHEGLHALIVRDHLVSEEYDVLRNFVRNPKHIVQEELDENAHNADLTWYERSVVQFADSNLSEGDIEKEAIISLLENMVRHPNVFDIRETGKKVRKVGSSVQEFIEGFVDAAKDANIVDVMRILGRIESGAVGERGAGYLGDPENKASSMIRSNDLLRYANPQDIERLRAAVVLRDAAPSDEMRASEQAKVDDIADKIIANKGIIQESAGPLPDALEAIENQRKLIQDSRDTATGSIPLIGLDQEFKDSEEYKLALATFMEMRGKDPRYAYKMPAPYQTFFDNKRTIGDGMNSWVDEALDNGTLSPTAKDATRKSIEGGPLSGRKSFDNSDPESTGETVEVTRDNLKSHASQLRYNYLDRRQWVVEQTDRLIAAQNRAQLDAETSALVMWRNSDNAVNFLRGLMLRGPLSYLGRSVGAGNFENVPVYDNDLQEKYGGDGRIQGLNDIIAPIIDSRDQEAAILYGIAKRVQWTKGRRDSFRLVSEGTASLDPETKLKWQMFEESYNDIRESVKKFTDDQLNAIIKEVEANESDIVEFWDRYNAYDNHMIKMSYNAGMITREQRDEWLSMPYAPFYRESDDIEKFPIGSQQELAQRGINLVEKSLQKSRLPITTDLANSIISNTQALVRDAMMNVSVSRTVRDAVILGEAKKISISGLAASVKNNVVRVMEDGVPVFYELADSQLAMSSMMLGFNPKKQLREWFGEHKVGVLAQKALTGASSLLRESVTRTPPFAIKNVFRDSWTAMSLTGGGPGLVLKAFANAFNVDSLRRADELGLSIGIDFLAEPGEYGSKMEGELKKANLDWRNPLDAVAAAWHFSGRIAQQSEVATRLAVYDRVLAMTGDKALALHYAVEIMNYGRRGMSQILSTYMSTVPFMNGRLQGMDVTYRGLRSKEGSSDIPGTYGYGLTADEYSDLPSWQKNRQQILGRGLALTFATTALYFLMRDDEEWEDLREEVKSDNWVLPLSDHAWLKIPIPFEVGVLFKTIPEKMLEAMLEEDVSTVDVGEETWRQLRTSLSIGGWPQLLAPIVGAMRNYDAFRKDTIVDPWMEETLSANEQRNRYTSNVARGIADFANSIPLIRNLDFLTSPMKVEYMARQWGGTAGGYVITLADRLARTGILLDLPFDPYMNLAGVESVIGTNRDFDWKSLVGGVGVVNVPILGDLLTDPRTRGGRQQQFYGMIEELDLIVATLNSISERDYRKGFKYRDKHIDILRHKNQLRFIENQMRKWRERRDQLSRVPPESMSKDEERAYYQRLLESRQSILTSVNDLMASIKSGTV